MAEKSKSENIKGSESSVTAMVEAEAGEPETHEVIFSVNTATGEVVKIEKLEKAGNRQELNEEEYAQIAAIFGADLTAGAGAEYDPDALSRAEACYHQGMADYAAAVELSIAQSYGYSLEELAYYQGAADYAASLG